MKRPLFKLLAFTLTVLMILTAVPLQYLPVARADDPPEPVAIAEGTPLELTIGAGEAVYVSFAPSVTNYYALWSVSDGDPRCSLYDAIDGSVLAQNDDYEGNNFRVVYKLEAGKEYFYLCDFYRSAAGTVTVNVGIAHNLRTTLTSAPTATEPGVITTACIYDGCDYCFTEETALGVPINAGETVTIPKGDPGVFVPVVFNTPDVYHRFELKSANNNNVQTFMRRWMVGDYNYYDSTGFGTDRNFVYDGSLNENRTYVFFCRPNPEDDYTVTLTMMHGDYKYLTTVPTETQPGEFTHRCGQCDYSYTESIPPGLILTEGNPVTVPAGDPSAAVPVVFTPPDDHRYRLFSSDNGGQDVFMTRYTVDSYYTSEYNTNTGDGNVDYSTGYYEDSSYVFLCQPIEGQSYRVNIEKKHNADSNKSISRVPTLTEEGEYLFACSECDYSYTEAIPKAVEIHEGETLDLAENGSDVAAVSFTPTASHHYILTSSDRAGGADPTSNLYFAGTTRRIAYDDDSAGDRNFKIAATLDAGRTYIYLCKISAGWSYKVTLTTPHEYNKTLTLAPTATEPGEFTYNCYYCDDSYTESIPAGIVIAPGESVTIPKGDPNVPVPVIFNSTVDHQYRFESSDNGGSYSNTTSMVRWPVGADESSSWTATGYYSSGYNFTGTFTAESGGTDVMFCRPLSGQDYKVTLSLYHKPEDYSKQITRLPTLTEEGEYTYTCEKCGDTYTEAIPIATAVSLDTPLTVNSPDNKDIIVPLLFTPSVTHRYVIESKNYISGDDPRVTMYGSSDLSKSFSDDDGGDDWNFKLTPDLTAGETYAFFCRVKVSAGYQVTVSMPHEYDKTLTALPTPDAEGAFTCKCKYCDNSYTEPIPRAARIRPGESVTVPQGDADTLFPVCFTPEITHIFDLISSDNNGAKTGMIIYRLGAGKIGDIDGYGSGKTFDHTLRYNAEDQYLYLMKPSPDSSYRITLSPKHTYASSLTVLPTAGSPGELTYQCTECSEGYTETISPASQLIEDEPLTLTGAAGQHFIALTFTPTRDHRYVMESSDYSRVDPRAVLYEAGSTAAIASDDDNGTAYNFKIAKDLTPGKTYVLLCRSVEGCSFKVLLSAPHDYKRTLTQTPTATLPGVFTYQCSGCPESYTETTPPLTELSFGESVTVAAGSGNELVPVRLNSDVEHYGYFVSENNGGKNVSGFTMTPGEDSMNSFSGYESDKYNIRFYRFITPDNTLIYFFRRIEGVSYTLSLTPSHSYKQTLTTLPTTTSEGEFTYVCTCGDSNTEPIPAAIEIHDNERLPLTGNEKGVIPIIFTAPKNGTVELISDSTYGVRPSATLYLEGSKRLNSTEIANSSFSLESPLEGGKTYLYLVQLNNNSLCSVTLRHIHNYERAITNAPTCTADGLATFTCSYCGDAYTRVLKNRHTDADLNAVCDICGEHIKFAEVAIVVDTTGSMGNTIKQIRQKINEAVAVLEEAGYNYRLALVDYRDFPDRPNCIASDYPYDVKQDFTAEPVEIYAAVNSLTLGGGGDGPETVFSGLADGLRALSWSPASWKGAILIGDASPLDPEPNTGYTMDQATGMLNGNSVTGGSGTAAAVYPGQIVHVDTISTGSTVLSSFKTISDNTGGNSYSGGATNIGDIIIKIFEGLTAGEHYHTPTVAVAGRNATCQQTGLTAEIVCSECGKTLQEQTETAKLAHNYEEKVEDRYLKVAAGCISKAIYYKSCSMCGERGNETFFHGNPNGHKWVEKVDAKYLKTAVSCTERGVYYKSCSVCGAASAETFTEAEPSGHSWADKAEAQYLKSAATCTERAVYYKSCTLCGQKSSETFAYGNPNGHGASEVRDAKTPTCSAAGYSGDSYCRVCGAKVATGAAISALGHDFGAWTKLDSSDHQRVCSRDASHVEKAPHTWDGGKVTKEAAIGKAGEKTFTCTVCGEARTEAIPALDAPVTEPPVTETPATEPPATEPPVTEPPATEPPVTEPPVTEPPATEPPATTTQPSVGYQLGDIDKDAKVTSIDARKALRIAAKLDTCDDLEARLADMDGDGKVTSIDARVILRIAAKLDPLPDRMIYAVA